MSHTINADSETFQAEVLDAEGPVMVDFGAVWCSPCKMLDPIVDELAAEWAGAVKVVKVDIDHSPDIAFQYQIMGVPTLMVFKDGEVLDRMSGFKPKDKILQKFSEHFSLA